MRVFTGNDDGINDEDVFFFVINDAFLNDRGNISLSAAPPVNGPSDSILFSFLASFLRTLEYGSLSAVKLNSSKPM